MTMNKSKADIVAVVVSVLALALSSFTVYIQFFHNTSKLSAILTDVNTSNNEVDFIFALTNAGTLPQLVLPSDTIIKFSDSPSTYSLVVMGVEGNDKLHPFVLDPKQIKMVVIRVKAGFTEKNIITVGNKIDFLFTFKSFDANGKKRAPLIRAVTAQIEKKKMTYYYYPHGVFDLRSEKNYPEPMLEVKGLPPGHIEAEQESHLGPLWQNMIVKESHN